MLVGLISDTHGLLRPEALAALQGSVLIIHAGDVGRPDVLVRLREVAPTFGVRGNIDTQPWAAALPMTEAVEAGPHLVWVLHDIAQLDLDPTVGFAAVVYGHSHKPSIETRDGVLYVNPGSAGPRRFGLPVTVARLRINGADIYPEIVDLDV
ncbi:MAG TPA: metallophosphoesterase family protein [Hyphomicrobiaceae bacterium]|jgi:putative phosphoesterase